MKNSASMAALVNLVVLQVLMLGFLFAKVPPHPPVTIPLSGIGPLIGASICLALCAIIIGPNQGLAGKLLSVGAIALALISFGPQKYFDAQFPLIWPAVLTAQASILTIIYQIWRTARGQQNG